VRGFELEDEEENVKVSVFVFVPADDMVQLMAMVVLD
jgi:hypothetical protein